MITVEIRLLLSVLPYLYRSTRVEIRQILVSDGWSLLGRILGLTKHYVVMSEHQALVLANVDAMWRYSSSRRFNKDRDQIRSQILSSLHSGQRTRKFRIYVEYDDRDELGFDVVHQNAMYLEMIPTRKDDPFYRDLVMICNHKSLPDRVESIELV